MSKHRRELAESYWDHLLIRDAVLVLLERLGGVDVVGTSMTHVAIPGGEADRVASVGMIAALGESTPVKAMQGGSAMFDGDRLGSNFTGGAVFQLVRDYHAVKGQEIILQGTTERLTMLALRSAGIDQDNLNGMCRGAGNFGERRSQRARNVA